MVAELLLLLRVMGLPVAISREGEEDGGRGTAASSSAATAAAVESEMATALQQKGMVYYEERAGYWTCRGRTSTVGVSSAESPARKTTREDKQCNCIRCDNLAVSCGLKFCVEALQRELQVSQLTQNKEGLHKYRGKIVLATLI